VRVLDDAVLRRLARELSVELLAQHSSSVLSPGTPGTARGEGTYVARISSALHARLEWRLDLLLHKQLKVDVLGKEWVLLDRLCAGDAESEGRVAREEAGQERARVRCDLVGELERVREDLRAGCQWGEEVEEEERKCTFWYISLVFSE
jgi:hypothetical protein